jgi:hypothetical protein
MPTGLSGDTQGNLSLGNDPVLDLDLIESRVISMLLQQMMGGQAVDDLDRFRNDIAVQLGIPVPVAGATN